MPKFYHPLLGALSYRWVERDGKARIAAIILKPIAVIDPTDSRFKQADLDDLAASARDYLTSFGMTCEIEIVA